MSPRWRRVLWGLFIVLVAVGMGWAYYHWVWQAPASEFKWVRGDKTYELLEPRTIGVVLLAPLLLFVLGRSLADLPWQQRVLSVILRIIFVALIGLGSGAAGPHRRDPKGRYRVPGRCERLGGGRLGGRGAPAGAAGHRGASFGRRGATDHVRGAPALDRPGGREPPQGAAGRASCGTIAKPQRRSWA